MLFSQFQKKTSKITNVIKCNFNSNVGMKLLCKDLWKQILLYVGFSMSDLHLSVVSKFFYLNLLPLWLDCSFVFINFLCKCGFKNWLQKYAWCINKSYFNFQTYGITANEILNCEFRNLTQLSIENFKNVYLPSKNFPKLVHLKLSSFENLQSIHINELSLITLQIRTQIEFQFTSNTLQFLAYHAPFWNNNMMTLLHNLPNLKYLILNRRFEMLQKAFPNIQIETDWRMYFSEWKRLLDI